RGLRRGGVSDPGAAEYSQHATSGGLASSIRGSLSAHGPNAYGQRGWKLQPVGMLNGLGTVPLITFRRWPFMPLEGMDVSRPSVYGCFGASRTSSTEPCSTMRPAYI